ncbi:MAG: FliH/SctL family protein [Myxococcaceae bacterium]
MDEGPRDDRRSSGGASAPRVVGKVIKGDAVPEVVDRPDRPALRAPRPGVLNSEEFEARTTAQRIKDDAEKAAAEIVAEANRQRDEVFAKARDEAKAEVAAQSSAELAKAKMQAGQILAASENDLISLACKIAEKIIGKDLERQPEVVVDICATAIENVRHAKSMVLRVNPRDGVMLREKRPTLMSLVGRAMDISIKDDPDVEAGGCIIQTEFGTIDAQLKTQFEMLKTVLVPDNAKKEGPK